MISTVSFAIGISQNLHIAAMRKACTARPAQSAKMVSKEYAT